METTTKTLRVYTTGATLQEQKKNYYSVCFVFTAFVFISFVLYIDINWMVYPNVQPSKSFWMYVSRQITAEGFPVFSGLYFLRLFLLTASGALITASAMYWSSRQRMGYSRFYVRSNRIVFPKNNNLFSKSFQNLALGALTCICVSFLVVFLKNPATFYWLCLEDHRIESLSDVLQFTDCGLFIYIWFLLGKKSFPGKRLYRLVAGLFVVFFFLSAMEEVSWFQRVFHVKTPAAFSANLQNEINLHNFATHPVENVYYFFAFAFLVFVPFFKSKTQSLKASPLFSLFTPDDFVLLFSVPFVAYNYTNLNVFAVQLSVGITFFILLDRMWRWYYQPSLFGWTIVIFLVFIVSQILFLKYGDRMVRPYDVKEYKEMLIPLAFLVFGIGVLKKIRQRFNAI